VLKIYCALSAECTPDRALSVQVPSAAEHCAWAWSLVERGGRKALLETLHTKKNVGETDIHESKEKIRAHRASSKATRLFLTKR